VRYLFEPLAFNTLLCVYVVRWIEMKCRCAMGCNNMLNVQAKHVGNGRSSSRADWVIASLLLVATNKLYLILSLYSHSRPESS
jgi:hypothetical protein